MRPSRETHPFALPSRREFIALGMGAFVLASLPRAARPRPAPVWRRVPLMGTIAEIVVVHRDVGYAQAAIDAALMELRFVDRTMTRFDPRSEIGRLNLVAGSSEVAVSMATAEVLEEALRWARATDGAFDPCLGRAIALWDVAHRTVPPPRAEVRRFAGRRLYGSLELDRSTGQAAVAVLHSPEASIDLGGIAKGHGVDRAVTALRQWGVGRALVNVGGDLYALGRSEDDEPWRIGIRDPFNPGGLIAMLPVENRALATSGDYEQSFRFRGRQYHHLLDPRTGEPRWSRWHSVTVAGDSCMQADAAGTAVFGQDLEQARRAVSRIASGLEVLHVG